MNELKFRFYPSFSIEEPFTLEYCTIEETKSLLEMLGLLFPAALAYYKGRRLDTLTISAQPGLPFGPYSELLLRTLFPDFSQALRAVKNHFSLKRVNLVGFERSIEREKGIYIERRGAGRRGEPVLGIFDFYRLARAVLEGKSCDSQLVSIFFEPRHIYSFIVPLGTELYKLLEFSIERYGLPAFDFTKGGLFNPMTGESYDLEKTKVSYYTKSLCAGESSYRLACRDDLLFTFPLYRRELRLIKGRAEVPKAGPCSNCMACSSHCPAHLQPNFIYFNYLKGSEVGGLDPFACLRCGICSLVCPANIPLCKGIKEHNISMERGDSANDD